MYEGTCVTQDVKKSKSHGGGGLGFAALFLLALAGLSSTVGCSENEPTPNEDGESGGAACPGRGCQAPSGRFTSCTESAECDEAHGFSCVDGECSYECQSHADCVEVGHCEPRTVDHARKNFCVRDAAPPKAGELYSRCPKGDECADPALCVGAGAGDLDAYCTIDCASDDDCRAGYFCGTLPGDTSGVERSVCRQREFCSPCASDADCLGVPNQICAKDESGEKICTRLCDTEAQSCPWGNAAKCGYFDDDLGAATCSHRFGSCHGSGQTCEPCRSNDDCPGGGCAASSFTGERWCVNFDTRCECPNGPDASGACSDGGCPPSPSGLVIQCIGSEQSSLFNTCYAASSGSQTQLGASPQTGCWGAD